MALNINGRMKVKTLRADFLEEFGLTLRIYDGRSFADENATLASIRKGDSKGGEFSPKRNTKVGNLEDKIMDMFGIKTQVAGSDDSYLCNNDLTLAGALEEDDKKLSRKEKKADRVAKDTSGVIEESSSGAIPKESELNLVTLVLDVESYFNESSDEVAYDQGFDDYDSMDEEEKEDIFSTIMYTVLSEYVRERVVDLFDVRVANRDTIDAVYLKFGDKFVNLDDLDDINDREYEKLRENGMEIAAYFSLSEPINFDGPYDSFFIKLSRGIDNFKLIVPYSNKIIWQGYCEGDFDSGYLSNDEEEWYVLDPKKDNHLNEYVADKEKILNNLMAL